MDQAHEIAEWFSEHGERLAFLAYCACFAFFAWFESAAPGFREPQRRQERWPVNLGIGILNIGLAMITPVTAVVAAQWAKDRGIGLLNIAEAGFWISALATVFGRTLVGYALHVANHKIGFLWRFHRVHHSDTHLDVSTSVRNHPGEFVLLVSVTGSAAILFGFNPWALAAVELFENFVNSFAHANIRLPDAIDRPLRFLFVTPNMHCLHHSSYQPETDSNYGQVFSIWDRLFGTYSAAPRKGYDAMKLGLNEVDFEHASDVVWQLKLPALDIGAARRSESAPERKS